jgi:predicted dehydrogenase
MYRFMDSALIMKRAIDEGRLGRLIVGECRVKFLRTQAYYDSGSWRGKWATEGGGCMPTNASHTMDLLFWMMGDLESIAGYYGTLGHNIEVEDTVVASLRFRNGALGQVLASTAVKPGYPRTIEITGARGTIGLEDDNIVRWDLEDDPEGPHILETHHRRDSVDVTHSKPAYASSELHRRQLRDFIDAIREGRPPRIDGTEGRKTLEIIRAIYQAADTGESVKLPIVERSVGPATRGTLTPVAL